MWIFSRYNFTNLLFNLLFNTYAWSRAQFVVTTFTIGLEVPVAFTDSYRIQPLPSLICVPATLQVQLYQSVIQFVIQHLRLEPCPICGYNLHNRLRGSSGLYWLISDTTIALSNLCPCYITGTTLSIKYFVSLSSSWTSLVSMGPHIVYNHKQV